MDLVTVLKPNPTMELVIWVAENLQSKGSNHGSGNYVQTRQGGSWQLNMACCILCQCLTQFVCSLSIAKWWLQWFSFSSMQVLVLGPNGETHVSTSYHQSNCVVDWTHSHRIFFFSFCRPSRTHHRKHPFIQSTTSATSMASRPLHGNTLVLDD